LSSSNKGDSRNITGILIGSQHFTTFADVAVEVLEFDAINKDGGLPSGFMSILA